MPLQCANHCTLQLPAGRENVGSACKLQIGSNDATGAGRLNPKGAKQPACLHSPERRCMHSPGVNGSHSRLLQTQQQNVYLNKS